MKNLEVCGGCNAKIAAGNLDKLLKDITPYRRHDVLVGFDKNDDAAIIDIDGETCVIQTLDFFPTMVEDPYLFGQIAAANALSDVYAMGGEVISALNIVTFPLEEDFAILKEILRGGNDKVSEAKASLTGGHSIHDKTIKYGLSVTGKVKKKEIRENNTPKDGDVILLTKKIGTGLVTANFAQGLVSDEDFEACTRQMATLNKYARDIFVKYQIHAATDITGFGLLGHLSEMAGNDFTIILESAKVPVLSPAKKLAAEFLYTSGGQNNRNYLEGDVEFMIDDFAMEEVLFDPQTSGGLCISVSPEEADKIITDFRENNLEIYQIGQVKRKRSYKIIVK
ncbi:Selenide, water dikinase [Anaerococcus prevotii]|uniref:Selenide, water dikinase n=1 Tax=Anaerococcus prevotii (strain ATCC 9321 / DSM 20548 / JCM 6508 / NCTC 11806 / PC1) TaxID=525919 RepID=C7RG06_ANAPD|nr:selenide, water dikinase SelD [Anaerococcus prevotii]ACV28417.1 selenide, water dikinase [Anaerococcus prevotii DSM 20548]SUU93976.1 Selenide, water dikinase [Anaerococcus prevotii]